MGYRNYMHIVPKDVVNRIKDMTYQELAEYAKDVNGLEEDEDGAWVRLHEIIGRNEFHCFGKWYENSDNIEALGTPLFSNPETQKHFCEYSPYVIGIDAVLCAIEDYRKKIVKWYSDLLMTQEEYDARREPWERRGCKQEDRIREHLTSQKEEWENNWGCVAINTDMDSPNIVRSWLYEYAIFELVHQMKTMDWEKNTLVFWGW